MYVQIIIIIISSKVLTGFSVFYVKLGTNHATEIIRIDITC
jgi:hypothetical protein